MKISFTSHDNPFEQTCDSTLVVVPIDANKKNWPTLPQAAQQAAETAFSANVKPLKTGVQIVTHCAGYGTLVLVVANNETRSNLWELSHIAVQRALSEKRTNLLLVAPNASQTQELVEYAYGARLTNYQYRQFWNKKATDQPTPLTAMTVVCANAKAAAQASKQEAQAAALAEGVYFTRDLVSAPPNVLYPETFAAQLQELKKYGIKVDVLDVQAMEKLGMGALLGVGQGSRKPPRLAVMHWDNNPDQKKPLAIVGKGVTFDTGGISLKPSKNMEEMKFDMAGAGVVAGVMKALALQKAALNVVGVVALAENMPDGNAQRPGDIVTAMDGQTIAVHNTDAEGRLVLADALHYTINRFQPTAIVNLATLTGAIIVALGSEHAGLFSNNDDLAAALLKAGQKCNEKLWRMPLHKNYDAQLDTLAADMCNIGGSEAGSITAAQFLQRFVGDTPWAHLDIAGVAWNNKDKPAYPAGASAFGVTLLHDWLYQTAHP